MTKKKKEPKAVEIKKPERPAPRLQCSKCPWKVSTNPYDIPNDYCPTKHANLKDTIAPPEFLIAGSIRIMACHESPTGKELPCVGWFHHQMGVGNNIGLRLAVMSKNIGIDANVQTVGEQHERFEDTLPDDENCGKV